MRPALIEATAASPDSLSICAEPPPPARRPARAPPQRSRLSSDAPLKDVKRLRDLPTTRDPVRRLRQSAAAPTRHKPAAALWTRLEQIADGGAPPGGWVVVSPPGGLKKEPPPPVWGPGQGFAQCEACRLLGNGESGLMRLTSTRSPNTGLIPKGDSTEVAQCSCPW